MPIGSETGISYYFNGFNNKGSRGFVPKKIGSSNDDLTIIIDFGNIHEE